MLIDKLKGEYITDFLRSSNLFLRNVQLFFEFTMKKINFIFTNITIFFQFNIRNQYVLVCAANIKMEVLILLMSSVCMN